METNCLNPFKWCSHSEHDTYTQNLAIQTLIYFKLNRHILMDEAMNSWWIVLPLNSKFAAHCLRILMRCIVEIHPHITTGWIMTIWQLKKEIQLLGEAWQSDSWRKKYNYWVKHYRLTVEERNITTRWSITIWQWKKEIGLQRSIH